MKKLLHRCLGVGLALFLVFQAFPFSVGAQEDGADTQPSSSFQEEPSESNTLEAEWEGTGAMNPDGTPVTAEQGDTPEASGVVLRTLADEFPEQPATYTLTLDLDGGQVNTMQNAGWSQASYQTYQWTRSFTEETAGQGISLTMDGTLGGLIPGQPYRAGYRFTGWEIDQNVYGTESSQLVTITKDTTVVAQWRIATYMVSFQGSTGKLWSVEVPFAANLWTDVNNTPWTENQVVWAEDNTATVSMNLNGTEYKTVLVTRHPSEGVDASEPYYYTFTVDNVFYFTYGGPTPTKSGQHFTSWKLMSGGDGFTVTDNAVFAAQFQAEKSYVFNVYFYYENGTRAKDTFAVTKSETDVADGTLAFDVRIPEISHYKYSASEQNGVTWNGETVTVDVDTVFGVDNTAATNFLALTVVYQPADIQYTVEYYQQSVGTDEYTKVGETTPQTIEYGSNVLITDRPDLGEDVSFDGFQLQAGSQSAVTEGVVLREETPYVTFEGNSATVRVYYDRASYFIYFQTGTTEVQIDPHKIQYGAAMPSLEEYSHKLTRKGYKPVAETDIHWYRLDESENLEPIEGTISQMPAYDLYAVVTWTPATTSIRLVYWEESRNAASFQNAYTTTVEGVTTEAELTVSLNGNVTISGSGWPDGTSNGATAVEEGFKELIRLHYGEDHEDYSKFFSYSAEKTKASPGNVANAQLTNTGGVTEGAITEGSYTVKVNGDGSTAINIYYTRNLYTLEFVLARANGSTLQVATNTPGTFAGSGWTNTKAQANSFHFVDFTNGVTATNSPSGEKYGDLSVQKSYRLTEAVSRDPRSVVGRYGTKVINGFTCYVYTLTARFEAEITALWPQEENIGQRYGDHSYISMGTAQNSYYRNVFTGKSDQHNILNAYSTMDINVVAMGNSATNWNAQSDSGNGEIAHPMVAYWAINASEYHYYFLYEVLDTTISPSSENVKSFDPWTADSNGYSNGQYVSRNGKVYVYSTAHDVQNSTSTKGGQNQPSRHGFVSRGSWYSGDAGDKDGGNIYFFYDRERFVLEIQNLGNRYAIPQSLLTTPFGCLSSYGENIQTLKQLGWESVSNEGRASIRFGGALAPLGEDEVITWLTETTAYKLEYPHQSAGESQYYFWRWYRNDMHTVPVDWKNEKDMQTMASNTTLYAGWFTPRYTTSYVLNGGTWADNIDYTLDTSETADGHRVYIYYPHQFETGEDAPLYWYIQSKDNDRLFVDSLYVCQVEDVAHQVPNPDETGAHWELDAGLSVQELLDASEEDFQGSRLVDHYYCYIGAGSAYNHENYININSPVNQVLSQPNTPTRTGYTFKGWFYFDDVPESGTKVYLKDVLTGNQSLASYGDGYVYLNHVSDAYLLHEDENRDLFYYPDQTGYRFSYSNNASVVVRDLQLYAAWEPKGDAKGVVYHLVEKDKLNSVNSFTPKGESDSISVDTEKTIIIGSVEYYILRTEELPSLYTGSTYTQTAWEYCTDSSNIKWLPAQASIDLYADSRTQTVASDDLTSVTGNTYRVVQGDGTYTYYAFFVYNTTGEVVYNVYGIDLSVAVAEGVLDSYQDTFDRSFQVDPTAPYFLRVEQKSVKVEDITTTLVTENAPSISGYSVYQDWSQVLQLQTQAEANNIFFYYVRDDAQIDYTITYYRMVDGKYSSENKVTISNIPAVTGEIISLEDMASTYDHLVTMAQTYSSYVNSANEAQKSLYERYSKMTVTLTQDGVSTSFTVDTDGTDTLDLATIADFDLDYYVDGWSPNGSNLVVSDNTEVEVYLAAAQLIVQKVDTSQLPLTGAEFQLQRLVEDANGTIFYGGKNYSVDPSFQPVSATSGEDGKAIFYNLSARVLEGGTGYLYSLTETKAPTGYNRLADPIYVTTPYTVGEEVHYSVTYTVVNSGVPYLPNAGSFGGVYITMFLGTGLMAAAIGLGIVLWRRKRSHS